jgi:hypothetical protein
MVVATLPWEAELELGAVDESISDTSKGQINDLPQLACAEEQIMVADTLQKALAGVRLLRDEIQAGRCSCGTDSEGQPVICMGFDTETKPKFDKGNLQHSATPSSHQLTHTAPLITLLHATSTPPQHVPLPVAHPSLVSPPTHVKVVLPIPSRCCNWRLFLALSCFECALSTWASVQVS